MKVKFWPSIVSVFHSKVLTIKYNRTHTDSFMYRNVVQVYCLIN